MKEPIKKALTDHFERVDLTTAQLANLKRLQAGKTPMSKQQRLFLVGLIAVAALIAVLIYLPMPIGSDLTFENVATEIAYNHNKNMDLEFPTADIAEIRLAMNKLDFNPVSSPLLSGVEWQLVGSRYCSIRGKIAAQMRFRNLRTNARYTLYQTAFPAGLSEETYVGHSKGNTVKIWKEKDLLMGLAGPE